MPPVDVSLHQGHRNLSLVNESRTLAGRTPLNVVLTVVEIIAAINDPAVIAKILAHLGLPTRAPPRHLRYAPTLRNPASLAYQPKPSVAWAFAARSQLTPHSRSISS